MADNRNNNKRKKSSYYEKDTTYSSTDYPYSSYETPKPSGKKLDATANRENGDKSNNNKGPTQSGGRKPKVSTSTENLDGRLLNKLMNSDKARTHQRQGCYCCPPRVCRRPFNFPQPQLTVVKVPRCLPVFGPPAPANCCPCDNRYPCPGSCPTMCPIFPNNPCCCQQSPPFCLPCCPASCSPGPLYNNCNFYQQTAQQGNGGYRKKKKKGGGNRGEDDGCDDEDFSDRTPRAHSDRTLDSSSSERSKRRRN